MSLPNLLTIARILLVPVAVWLIINDEFPAAFTVFVLFFCAKKASLPRKL